MSLALDMDVQEAKESRRVAKALENLPALAEAAEAGRLRWGKLREVVRVATPETNESWLEAALRLPCRKLVRLVRRARQGGDPTDEDEGREATRIRIELEVLPEEDELLRAAMAVLSAEAGRMLSPLEAVIDLCRQVVEGRLRTTPNHLRKTRELVEALQILRAAQDRAELQALEAEGYTCIAPSGAPALATAHGPAPACAPAANDRSRPPRGTRVPTTAPRSRGSPSPARGSCWTGRRRCPGKPPPCGRRRRPPPGKAATRHPLPCRGDIHKGRLSVSGDAEKTLTWRDRRGGLLGTWSPGELGRAARQAAAFLEERLAC